MQNKRWETTTPSPSRIRTPKASAGWWRWARIQGQGPRMRALSYRTA